MILYDAMNNWEDSSWRYRIKVIKTLLDALPEEGMNDELYNLVVAASDLEADDYFGTEGLRL
jgi:hypothetical protein